MVLSDSLGRRLTVRLQPLELRIGVRIPASQPFIPVLLKAAAGYMEAVADESDGEPERSII